MEKKDEIIFYIKKYLEFDRDDTSAERIAVLTKLIEIDPHCENSDEGFRFNHYYNRGVIYSYLKEWDKAIADYSKALEVDPNHLVARSNRGNAYLEKKEYDKAIQDQEKSLEMTPKGQTNVFTLFNLPATYLERGNYYLRRGNFDRAISDYMHIIEAFPKCHIEVSAYKLCAFAYFSQLEYDKANEYIIKAEEILKGYTEKGQKLFGGGINEFKEKINKAIDRRHLENKREGIFMKRKQLMIGWMKANKQLTVALATGMLIFLTVLLYPKRYYLSSEGTSLFLRKPIGELTMPVIQWAQVLPICIAISIIGGLFFYSLREKKK